MRRSLPHGIIGMTAVGVFGKSNPYPITVETRDCQSQARLERYSIGIDPGTKPQ
jgi:hypothetical protein